MKENDIRPKEIFDEYLRLVKEDIEKYFSNIELNYINCPACNNNGKFVFNKDNFSYYECDKCQSLYLNPRPKKSYFDAFYKDSLSSKYWATRFYKETEKNRREKIWKPKAKLIKIKLDKFLNEDFTLIDIGGGYGTFCEEISKELKNRPMMIEPSIYLSKVSKEKGFRVIENFLENIEGIDLPNTSKCFTSFELFEHLHNPREFLEVLYNLMSRGDLFIFTTLSSIGIDIQELWSNSKSIYPPHHINFLNPKSIKMLLEDIGYEVNEISTPGKLDIDILENNKKYIKGEFWKKFLEYSSKEEKDKMQKFLSDNLLSSHMMIVCKKV